MKELPVYRGESEENLEERVGSDASTRRGLFTGMRDSLVAAAEQGSVAAKAGVSVAKGAYNRRGFLKHAGAASAGGYVAFKLWMTNFLDKLFADREAQKWADEQTKKFYGESAPAHPMQTIKERVIDGAEVFAKDAVRRTGNTAYDYTLAPIATGIDYAKVGMYAADLLFLAKMKELQGGATPRSYDKETLSRQLRESLGNTASSEIMKSIEDRIGALEEDLRKEQEKDSGFFGGVRKLAGKIGEGMFKHIQGKVKDYSDALGIKGQTTLLFVTPGTVREEDVRTYIGAWKKLNETSNVIMVHSEYEPRVHKELNAFTQIFRDYLKGRVDAADIGKLLPVSTSVGGVEALTGPILTLRTPTTVHNWNTDLDMTLVHPASEKAVAKAVYYLGGSEHTTPLSIQFYSRLSSLSDEIVGKMKADLERGRKVFIVPDDAIAKIEDYEKKFSLATTPGDYLAMLSDLKAVRVDRVVHEKDAVAALSLSTPYGVDNRLGMMYGKPEELRRVSTTSRKVRLVNDDLARDEQQDLAAQLKTNAAARAAIRSLASPYVDAVQRGDYASVNGLVGRIKVEADSIVDVYVVADTSKAHTLLGSYDPKTSVPVYLASKGVAVHELSLEHLLGLGVPQSRALEAKVYERPEHPTPDQTWEKLGAAGLAGFATYGAMISAIAAAKRVPSITSKTVQWLTGIRPLVKAAGMAYGVGKGMLGYFKGEQK